MSEYDSQLLTNNFILKHTKYKMKGIASILELFRKTYAQQVLEM